MDGKKWSETADGDEVNPFDLNPSIITADNIAHALARINRFAGRWVVPVSVARHSVQVAKMLRTNGHSVGIQLQGLFHDAAEAFTVDIPFPMKDYLHVEIPCPKTGYVTGTRLLGRCVPYREFEASLLKRIFEVLKIEWPLRPVVHAADQELIELECRWVRGEDRELYRGMSTDYDVAALSFKYCAEQLFNERAHANNVPSGDRK